MRRSPTHLPGCSTIAALGMVLVACTTMPTLSPTSMPATATSTATLVPSPTTTATATLTPLPTDTPTVTPTPVPTLTHEQKTQFLEEMIRTNGGCELPCWWGGAIIPGQTTLEEVKGFFESQGVSFLIDDKPGVLYGGFQIPYPEFASAWEYDASFNFVGQESGMLQSLTFVGSTYTRKLSTRFTHVWREYYSWDHILTQNGKPTQVLFQIGPATYADPASFWLMLVYENLGMAIDYVGAAQDLGSGKTRACPSFDQVTSVSLTLVRPEERDSVVDYALKDYPLFRPTTLEEATGMSLETFYETFKNPGGTACFEGP